LLPEPRAHAEWSENVRVGCGSGRATAEEEVTLDRRIRTVKRDRKGNIVALCNAEAAWSPRRKADIIRDILDNKKSYYVQEQERRSYVRVVDGDKLQTTPDESHANFLGKLADS
jgi:hypothetical protein